MNNSLLRTNEELMFIYNRNVDIVYKICFMFMKNKFDAENIVQDAFVKLIENAVDFESYEHEKAWLIRTASNLCKNSLKNKWRKNVDIDDEKLNRPELCYIQTFESTGLTEKILSLPSKYKTVIYLYYYEGYKTSEIAAMLSIKESTIRGHLCKGRKLLKLELEEELII